MATKKEQRIRMKVEGSPVKWDGTITETSPDARKITVMFDGPMGEVKLTAFGDKKMISDALDANGQPTDDPRLALSCRWWEVL